MTTRRLLLLLLGVSACAAAFTSIDCAAQIKTDEEIFSEIVEHPYRAAGNHAPYYAPDVKYTPAPRGYKAFYVSHLGRHGSRYETNGSGAFDSLVSLLDSLQLAGALTLQGDSLRMDFHRLQQAHLGMDGMLTRKGSAEHTAIAERLVKRSPSIFNQKDRQVVYCTATTVQRTIQSMAGFIAGLGKVRRNNLTFNIGCRIPSTGYERPEDSTVDKNLVNSELSRMLRYLSPADSVLDGLQTRLFKGYRAPQSVLFGIFRSSSISGCMDIDVDPFRFFTPEELFALYRKNDVISSIKYGAFESTRKETEKKGKSYLRMIISEADAALEGNGRCADLRFAHDGNVGPVMDLLGIGGYDCKALDDAPYRYWQSYAQLSMGSNLQLEFYKNAKSDILVKALFNEREAEFPGLEAVNGIYYRWSDVRNYMIERAK